MIFAEAAAQAKFRDVEMDHQHILVEMLFKMMDRRPNSVWQEKERVVLTLSSVAAYRYHANMASVTICSVGGSTR